MSHAPCQLLYLVFGSDTYHLEAQFSIASVVRHLRAQPQPGLQIRVYTDQPARYAGWPVQVEALDAATLQRWAGPHQYLFRIKQQALLHCLARHPGKAVLLDTDTFLLAAPQQLFARVQPGQVLCNRLGQRYGDHRQHSLYQHLADTLRVEGLADDDLRYVNSGVIGLDPSDARVIEQSLALMDRFHPQAGNAFMLEEFCLAVAAYRRYRLAHCPDLLHHYWSRKALFRAKISAWHAQFGQQPLAPAALQAVVQVNGQVPRPPWYRRLLGKLLTLRMAPLQRQFSRELLYGCHRYPNPFDQACASAWWGKALSNAEQRGGAPVAGETLRQWLAAAPLTAHYQAALRAHFADHL